LSKVVSISAGWTRGLAACQDGSAVGWGTTIPAGTSNVVQVAAGVFYAAVLCRNGTVVICSSSPSYETPPADLTNAISFAQGAYHFLALRADGGLTSWGVGSYGQTNVPAWLTNVVAVSCGEFHSLALLNDGSPYFTCQPWNLSANSGDTLTFNPLVRGIEPVVYQWTFNGLALPGATNSSLTLTNVPLTSAGAYQCLASNRIGWAASHVATLAVNRSTLEWTAGKNAMAWDAAGFHLQLDRLSGHGAVVIYASTNLVDWQPVFTNPPAIGSFEYLDTNAARWPARFYRAVEQ
jgi:hypothetical protein